MIDEATLEVTAMIDWEYAGYFPRGMERWSGTFDAEIYRQRADRTAGVVARFLAVDYLRCCDELEGESSKVHLGKLIEGGWLPDPVLLRKITLDDRKGGSLQHDDGDDVKLR